MSGGYPGWQNDYYDDEPDEEVQILIPMPTADESIEFIREMIELVELAIEHDPDRELSGVPYAVILERYRAVEQEIIRDKGDDNPPQEVFSFSPH